MPGFISDSGHCQLVARAVGTCGDQRPVQQCRLGWSDDPVVVSVRQKEPLGGRVYGMISGFFLAHAYRRARTSGTR